MHYLSRGKSVAGKFYASPIVDNVAYKADGTPQQICAGFAALRRKLLGA